MTRCSKCPDITLNVYYLLKYSIGNNDVGSVLSFVDLVEATLCFFPEVVVVQSSDHVFSSLLLVEL